MCNQKREEKKGKSLKTEVPLIFSGVPKEMTVELFKHFLLFNVTIHLIWLFNIVIFSRCNTCLEVEHVFYSLFNIRTGNVKWVLEKR